MSYKSQIFHEVLEQFETKEMQEFCIDLLEKRNNINYYIPSSTSYKYHNNTQCQFGGQIYHELMVANIMNYILGLDYIKNKFQDPVKRDCLRIAAIMHDCMKTNNGEYTVHEHPILSGNFIEECEVEHDIDINYKKHINRLIQSHSGQWTTSNRCDVILPAPENDEQFLIHLCDYLSSRKDIDMTYSEDIIQLINDNIPLEIKPKQETWTFTFGKYRGKTFDEVYKMDRNYLIWLRDKASMDIREPLKSFLNNMK